MAISEAVEFVNIRDLVRGHVNNVVSTTEAFRSAPQEKPVRVEPAEVREKSILEQEADGSVAFGYHELGVFSLSITPSVKKGEPLAVRCVPDVMNKVAFV
ncbi:hypothetical protein [Halovivax gelatinilyticus]|uniref:hypothetical protein n=1 Tax=Halovivax gelatinilyticus TaxID=2961597 RepID=UPI0020CA4763|nr:hypothetical protein [Halovivax gelatinilyticus]